MHVFYFHLLTPKGVEPDDVGLKLSGVEAARREAVNAIPDVASELLRSGINPMRCAFIIEDDTSVNSFTLPFEALVAV